MENNLYEKDSCDRMFVYAWYEKTNINETKFGQRFVYAEQDPWTECGNRIRESIGVRKDLFDDGTIVLAMIWDVTALAVKHHMMDNKSKFDDFIRKNIDKRKGKSEVHSMKHDILIDTVNEYLRKEKIPPPKVSLSTAQYDDAVLVLDAINNGKRRILAELAARYGKTIWSSVVALESGIPVVVVSSYVLTSFTSFKNEIRKFEQFQNIEVVDTTNDDYQERIQKLVDKGVQVMVFLSLCNGSGRNERIDFLKNLEVQRLILVDEADYGAHQKNQFEALSNLVNEDDVLILMTGTNSDRASSDWDVDLMLSTTYFELLVNKKEALELLN
jgi:thymidine kinase